MQKTKIRIILFKIVNCKLKIDRNKNPVSISITGYCFEILVLQFLHLPPWRKKEKIGISSNHLSFLPQTLQAERPARVSPELKRSPTTLRKLPTIAPNTKGITVV